VQGNVDPLAFADLARDLGDKSSQKPPIAENQDAKQQVTFGVQEKKAFERARDQNSRHVAEGSDGQRRQQDGPAGGHAGRKRD
jgi:hypothetical protein